MDSKNYALRLPGELYEKLKTIAESEHRSLNAQIVVMLEELVEKKKEEPLRAGVTTLLGAREKRS